jgi:flagellar basal body-associated protein FliL
MDKINPFTNAPSNAPGQPAGPITAPNQQPKPQEPKQKKEFSIKPILKAVIMLIIGVIVAKLAFDSLVPPPKPVVKEIKPLSRPAVQKTAVPAKTKTTKGKQAPPLSLSEQFAAAKKITKPEQQPSNEQYVINGIFLSEKDETSSAIVNNKVVQVGDSVDGAIVRSITIEGVELFKEDALIKVRNK